MTVPSPDDQFVRDLTAHQHRLYGLIMSLLPDPERARDVLQETNVVLWRKSGEFTPGSDFGAWAAKVAYLQVMAYRTTQRRDRHVFDDELLGTLSAEAERLQTPHDDVFLALDACLERLPVPDRELLMRRYATGGTVKDLAQEIGKSPGAIRVALFRLRNALMECVERSRAAVS